MPQIIKRKFNGGVNEEDFLSDVSDNEIVKGVNVVITKSGSLKKREGSEEFGSDSGNNPVYALKGYTDSGSTQRRLKMIGTTLVEYNTGSWDTTVKAGLTASKYLRLSDIKVASTVPTTSGTASAGADYSLTDSGAGWTINAYRDFVVKIIGGTGQGQAKTILENTSDTLYVDGRWDVNPDSTSQFEIYPKVIGLICNNGTDTAFKVIQTTATDVTSIPKFTSQVVVNSRLWGVLGTKVYWSDLANGEAFAGYSYIDTGEDLVAIGQAGDFVAVYSKTKTGVITGADSDSFSFKWRDRARGCIAANSVAGWKGYSFALAQDGIYVFDGSVNRLVSKKVAPSIKNMKESLKVESYGFVFENKYYLLYATNSTSTVKDKMLVMDLIWSNLLDETGYGGVWTHFEGINANVMGTFADSNGLNKLYIGKSDSSKILWLYNGEYSDSGSSIKFDVEDKEYDGNAVGTLKKLGWFFYEGAIQSVTSDLQLYKNLSANGFELFGTVSHLQNGGMWDVAEWDVSSFSESERILERLRPGGRGRTVQYKFYNNLADQPIELFKYEQLFEAYRPH